MADVELVIKLPEEIYRKIKETSRFISGRRSGKSFDYILFNAVNNGTPLPKGQWIERVERDDWDDYEEVWYECDQCHVDSERVSKYCPNCGAKMGEREQK